MDRDLVFETNRNLEQVACQAQRDVGPIRDKTTSVLFSGLSIRRQGAITVWSRASQELLRWQLGQARNGTGVGRAGARGWSRHHRQELDCTHSSNLWLGC